MVKCLAEMTDGRNNRQPPGVSLTTPAKPPASAQAVFMTILTLNIPWHDVLRHCHRRQIWLNCEDVLTSSHDRRRLHHSSRQNCPLTGPLNRQTQTHANTLIDTPKQTDIQTTDPRDKCYTQYIQYKNYDVLIHMWGDQNTQLHFSVNFTGLKFRREFSTGCAF